MLVESAHLDHALARVELALEVPQPLLDGVELGVHLVAGLAGAAVLRVHRAILPEAQSESQ